MNYIMMNLSLSTLCYSVISSRSNRVQSFLLSLAKYSLVKGYIRLHIMVLWHRKTSPYIAPVWQKPKRIESWSFTQQVILCEEKKRCVQTCWWLINRCFKSFLRFSQIKDNFSMIGFFCEILRVLNKTQYRKRNWKSRKLHTDFGMDIMNYVQKGRTNQLISKNLTLAQSAFWCFQDKHV